MRVWGKMTLRRKDGVKSWGYQSWEPPRPGRVWERRSVSGRGSSITGLFTLILPLPGGSEPFVSALGISPACLPISPCREPGLPFPDSCFPGPSAPSSCSLTPPTFQEWSICRRNPVYPSPDRWIEIIYCHRDTLRES